MKCFVHEFHRAGNVIKHADLFLKRKFFFCHIHQYVELFLIDLSYAKSLQGVHIMLPVIYSLQKMFYKNPVLQFFAPRNEHGCICHSEGFFQ